MTIDVDEAERIAKAAKPAPWFHDKNYLWDAGGLYYEVDANGNEKYWPCATSLSKEMSRALSSWCTLVSTGKR